MLVCKAFASFTLLLFASVCAKLTYSTHTLDTAPSATNKLFPPTTVTSKAYLLKRIRERRGIPIRSRGEKRRNFFTYLQSQN